MDDKYLKQAEGIVFPVVKECNEYGDKAAQYLISSFVTLLANFLEEHAKLKENK